MNDFISMWCIPVQNGVIATLHKQSYDCNTFGVNWCRVEKIRFTVSLSRELHEKATAEAAKAKRGLSGEIEARLLSSYEVDGDELDERIRRIVREELKSR